VLQLKRRHIDTIFKLHLFSLNHNCFGLRGRVKSLLNCWKVLEVDTEINCAFPTYLRTSFVASHADGIVMTNR